MLKDNLAMLRRIHGYSQEEVAEKIGISRQDKGNRGPWDGPARAEGEKHLGIRYDQ